MLGTREMVARLVIEASELRELLLDIEVDGSVAQHRPRPDPSRGLNLIVGSSTRPRGFLGVRGSLAINGTTAPSAPEIRGPHQGLAVAHETVDRVEARELVGHLLESAVAPEPRGITERKNHVGVRPKAPLGVRL